MKRARYKTPLIILAIILLLIFFQLFGVLGPTLGTFQKILAPLQDATYTFSQKIKSIFYFKSSQDLKKENQELEEKLKNLLIDQVEFSRLAQENKFLRQELDFLENQSVDYKIAKIITKETFLGRKVLVLNKGKEDGVEEGYPVIISAENKKQGYLVGKIIKTENSISKVLLITDSRSMVAAKFSNSEKGEGVVSGERDLTLKMDIISPNQKINLGDIIITSGLENKIPEGLIIGEVAENLSKPGDFFGKAKINSFVDFDNLKILTILLTQNQ